MTDPDPADAPAEVDAEAGRRGDEPGLPPGRARRSRSRRILAIVALLVALFGAVTARLFAFPTTDHLRRADAIVVFWGDEDRPARAFALARAGYAPVVAISRPDQVPCPAAQAPDLHVLCFSPQQPTTRGEARTTADLAASHGWRTVIVVAGRAQETRARLRLSRCYHGRALVTGVDPRARDWPYRVSYEWGALAKALVWQRAC